MKTVSTVFITIALFINIVSTAQTATEKILGCWQLTKLDFFVPNENSVQLNNEAINTIVCFSQDGKFTTQKKTGNDISNGTYHIAPDEKSIYQTSEGTDETIWISPNHKTTSATRSKY